MKILLVRCVAEWRGKSSCSKALAVEMMDRDCMSHGSSMSETLSLKLGRLELRSSEDSEQPLVETAIGQSTGCEKTERAVATENHVIGAVAHTNCRWCYGI